MPYLVGLQCSRGDGVQEDSSHAQGVCCIKSLNDKALIQGNALWHPSVLQAASTISQLASWFDVDKPIVGPSLYRPRKGHPARRPLETRARLFQVGHADQGMVDPGYWPFDRILAATGIRHHFNSRMIDHGADSTGSLLPDLLIRRARPKNKHRF